MEEPWQKILQLFICFDLLGSELKVHTIVDYYFIFTYIFMYLFIYLFFASGSTELTGKKILAIDSSSHTKASQKHFINT